VKTYPLFRRTDFWHAAASMFLRATNRKKDGKDHRYFSIVENRRAPGGETVQRTVLYLGGINDQRQVAWRKTPEVFDEQEQRYRALSLFPDDREIPADAFGSDHAADLAQRKTAGADFNPLAPAASAIGG
jgi:hypothetical protein